MKVLTRGGKIMGCGAVWGRAADVIQNDGLFFLLRIRINQTTMVEETFHTTRHVQYPT